MESAFRQIPKMDTLIKAAEPLVRLYGRQLVVETLRVLLEDTRNAIARKQTVSLTVESLLAHLSERLAALQPSVVPCINATGTILHTGLGRSVLPRPLVNDLSQLLSGYAVLEVDLRSGERHNRLSRLRALLERLFRCEGGEGEHNGGGSFRLPETIKASGVRLVEVGT
ncbi:MAG: hypothetical protein DRP63_07210, partial [Planctomycetota bacterium]